MQLQHHASVYLQRLVLIVVAEDQEFRQVASHRLNTYTSSLTGSVHVRPDSSESQ